MNEQERMQFFYEMFHSSLSRLGPGTDACTVQALDIVRAARPSWLTAGDATRPRVLDLGCGTGPQTLVLARELGGTILANDNHQPNLDALRRRATVAGVQDRITTRLADMGTLEFDAGAFDLIWSEGALFCMGFRTALSRCRPWLADDGCFATSELCWLKPGAPAAGRKFIEGAYPVMTDIDGNLAAMRACGYTVLGHFALPESAWTDAFYNPLEARLCTLRERYASDADRMQMIGLIQKEIDNYRQCSAYYGYVFYVLQR